MANPLVQLDPDGSPQGTPGTLNYNVPDAISYPGRHFVALDLPDTLFHTLLSDTCYFTMPGVNVPVRANGVLQVNDAASLSYVTAAFEILQAMASGFQSNRPADQLTNLGNGGWGDAIMKVRGPHDRWFPDLPAEARSLRYAVSLSDPLYGILNTGPNVTNGLWNLRQQLPTQPVKLKNSDGVASDYTGVYTTTDTPEGSTAGLAPSLTGLTPYRVLDEAMQRRRLVIYRDVEGLLACKFVPFSTDIRQAFFLVEEYRLSSFYGNYGAGRTLSTMSLLPGEKTRLTLKTYRRSTETTKQSSSMLDSFSSQIAEDFQEAVESESTDKDASTRHDEGYVEAEMTGRWGTGKAKLSGGFKGASSSAREQMAKNVSKALQKHSSAASAKRDVKVEQSTETTTESGVEAGVEREIQNVNVGNTLNFVFRQMNQEHVTLLHLTDIKVAFSNSTYGSLRVVPLNQIDDLIRDYMPNADNEYIDPKDLKKSHFGDSPPAGYRKKIDVVRDAILTEASNVVDWKGAMTQAVEKVNYQWTAPTTALWGGTTSATATKFAADVSDLVKKHTGNPPAGPIAQPPLLSSTAAFHRFKPISSTYELGPNKFTVQGVIVAVNRNVMRTDGVMVDALLGRGDALDGYSHGLQDEALRAKANAAADIERQVALENLKQLLVAEHAADGVLAHGEMFPPTPTT